MMIGQVEHEISAFHDTAPIAPLLRTAHTTPQHTTTPKTRRRSTRAPISQRIMVVRRWFDYHWKDKKKTNNSLLGIMMIWALLEEIWVVNRPCCTNVVPGKERVKVYGMYSDAEQTCALVWPSALWIIAEIWNSKQGRPSVRRPPTNIHHHNHRPPHPMLHLHPPCSPLSYHRRQ